MVPCETNNILTLSELIPNGNPSVFPFTVILLNAEFVLIPVLITAPATPPTNSPSDVSTTSWALVIEFDPILANKTLPLSVGKLMVSINLGNKECDVPLAITFSPHTLYPNSSATTEEWNEDIILS